MDMYNYFFVLFVIVVKKFSEKKIGKITKKIRKIRTNCKNYNFCMHSRSLFITDDRNDIFDYFLFFCVRYAPGWKLLNRMFSIEIKNREDLEKNLEKLN
jgi:hypothetical protein